MRARGIDWRLALVVVCACAALAGPAAAQPGPPPPGPDGDAPLGVLRGRIAVLELEAVGMAPEPVSRLESLFRMELERLAGHPLPSRRQMEDARRSSPKLRACGGEDKCLAALGKKLGVDVVVVGNVAGLGDSYVLNIKAVDVATEKQFPKRIATPPLRGSPDELIEAVRVAAYDLLAPEQLLGSVAVLSDLIGAKVTLDGKPVGTTPIPRRLERLPLGKHRMTVEKPGYLPFNEEIEVRFQKTTRVVVHLIVEQIVDPNGNKVVVKPRPAPTPWYGKTWFLLGAGVGAVLVGAIVGYKIGHDPIIDCEQDPAACGM
ncbi:MAG TPA: PEGA domain-containing protein [Kofleriaceae bacterium]|nr:PEGA domain-containing protein [Kofleriaceae bacterium]